jgi:DNA helicase-2/ATP-dependent DNA helicase PcrA
MPKLKPIIAVPREGPEVELPFGQIVGTPEQEAIWKAGLEEGGPHLVVNAVAGSGKTTTGVELCRKLSPSLTVAFVAFNKHIATELQSRLREFRHVQAMTYHSLGLRALRAHLKQVEIDQYKVDTILDQLKVYGGMSDSKVRYLQARVRKLVGLAKQYGAWSQAELERLVDHHDLDLTNIEDEVFKLTPVVLKKCKEQLKRVDFDDMVWLPKELGVQMPQFDFLISDESQDLNQSQQWLLMAAAKRLMIVGDKNQAIMGFRGSDSSSMDNIRKALVARGDRPVIEMPLSLTRRCPKSHVRLAQRIVPGIQALENAPEGVIRVESTSKAVSEMRPGDLVVCRVNAPLLETAYLLLKQGVRAVVRGRDIGEGLKKLIENALKRVAIEEKEDVGAMLAAAEMITQEQVQKLSRLKSKSEARIAAAQDRVACLTSLSEGNGTVRELLGVIGKLFDEFDDDGKPQNAVVLGTVHRTKGLEGYRVYVLEPGKMPHPMAKKEWERAQELNILYVAVTRAKFGEEKVAGIGFAGQKKTYPGELVFVGGECPMFTGCSTATELTHDLHDLFEERGEYSEGCRDNE